MSQIKTYVTVSYTAYAPGTGNILAESTMTFPDTTNCCMCEQSVRAMYNGLEVIIRNSTPHYE